MKKTFSTIFAIMAIVTLAMLTGCSSVNKLPEEGESVDYGTITFYKGESVSRTEKLYGYGEESMATTNPNVFQFEGEEDKAYITVTVVSDMGWYSRQEGGWLEKGNTPYGEMFKYYKSRTATSGNYVQVVVG